MPKPVWPYTNKDHSSVDCACTWLEQFPSAAWCSKLGKARFGKSAFRVCLAAAVMELFPHQATERNAALLRTVVRVALGNTRESVIPGARWQLPP